MALENGISNVKWRQRRKQRNGKAAKTSQNNEESWRRQPENLRLAIA